MKKAPAGSFPAKPTIAPERPILVFDSGIGGLTVLREARVVMPDRRFVYIADDAGFPYGNWEEEALKRRIIELFGEFIANYDPEIAVIACNTASTLVLEDLRRAYPSVPFCRHGASHKACRRANLIGACFSTCDARHGEARLYARPDPVFCIAVPCASGGGRRAGGDCRSAYSR